MHAIYLVELQIDLDLYIFWYCLESYFKNSGFELRFELIDLFSHNGVKNELHNDTEVAVQFFLSLYYLSHTHIHISTVVHTAILKN